MRDTAFEVIERLAAWGFLVPPEDSERRHLELLAATLHNSASRTMDELLKSGGPLPDDDEWVVKEAVMTARAIQAEVRRASEATGA